MSESDKTGYRRWFSSVVVVLVVFAVIVPEVSALKCFICNSKYNGTACLSPPQKQHLQDCPLIDGNQATLCRTMFISMGTEGTTVDRRCGYIPQHKDCLNTATFQIKSTTCQCRVDGCNASSMTGPTFGLIALSALIGVVLCRSAQ